MHHRPFHRELTLTRLQRHPQRIRKTLLAAHVRFFDGQAALSRQLRRVHQVGGLAQHVAQHALERGVAQQMRIHLAHCAGVGQVHAAHRPRHLRRERPQPLGQLQERPQPAVLLGRNGRQVDGVAHHAVA